ncbi:TonB-dependent receptor [Solitalea canadensis]|uniref:TonB-dependent siderophore receptor n=1 Tax=Solitalea canadensis (strain ATCC 29591 / DSM 3403 / JCM 21819 / LMG 8368 / NBRC 15130 / NCIMB 12057 / USAM 9D) TaxID=929556 RepID=H8KW97_SOLCM|nr:TonB-dependent receptor [Solitalea canadensis]AFD07889.1 TonB-dependent siderophore receptor [Solitalea canadensis DSM 3403]
MIKHITLLLLAVLSLQTTWAQSTNTSLLKGKITGDASNKVDVATVTIIGTKYKAVTDAEGFFEIKNIQPGNYTIHISALGFEPLKESITVSDKETTEISFTLKTAKGTLNEVEVFGMRDKQPEKLDAITRLPLKPKDQIQSISVISDKLITQQGNLTVIDATRNVAGVYTYSRYGNSSESISSRGFRGIPIYKNGVRMHSDFRGFGFISDMGTVESIQVLKGSAAVTMGAATDLGSPGGLINVVTKTPKFTNNGVVSLRAGGFSQFRPTFDIQGLLNKEQTLAFRLNGGYENSRTFHNIEGIGTEKLFINPSLEWRPDSKTAITFELDYLDDSRSLDVGTVNIDPKNISNRILEMPKDKFLGFDTDRQLATNTNVTARFRRDITDNLYVRGAFYRSNYDTEGYMAGLKAVKTNVEKDINVDQLNVYSRSIGSRGGHLEKNNVLQFDLIGKDIQTGKIKHTFQAGLDYRTSYVKDLSYASIVVDTIDVFQSVSNKLKNGVPSNFTKTGETESNNRSAGFTIQDVVQLTAWARVYGSIRFSTTESSNPAGTTVVRESYWNPLGGVMFSINKNINLFGSYTNSTNPRTAQYLDINGDPLGNERIDQFEAGLKTEWFNERLRFNFTAYKINNKNQNIRAAVLNPATGFIELQNYYFKGGNDERTGIETEITGRILPNLEVIAGYAYINAKYKEHTTFVPGSAPNNTPKHTFNAWGSYTIDRGPLKSLNFSAGIYYLGDRPYNDWTQANAEFHGITPNQEPWNNKAYTVVNVQLGYEFTKNWSSRVFVNNVFDAIGYDAYRTSYIDRIDPRNVSVSVSYRF